MRVILVAFAISLFGFLSFANDAHARTKLTKAEVQQLIIGKRWHNNNGKFIFRSNGTYQYDRLDGSFTFRGDYALKENGLIKGKSTSYRFYRKKDGSYLYYHSSSRKFIPVIFY